ncbi:hypothetical protein JRO89_XS10G0036800 [Xanthoceras sorbifolium]|uniref:F-box domain-containing protein n=1 Tax=Xanthoceras sorbifolium TaxID=99658 RepID=A0ABQ8HHK0_9ROSI|nr:hypothetical protein JRO89_XS10G0036800 [Xanthoceras sorbifolium]
MEGALQRRERGGSSYYHLRPKLQLLSSLGTKTDEDETYEPQKQCRKKRKKTCNDVSHRGWADLPVELLGTIYSTLTIVDFLNFGKVCSSWRLSFSFLKQNFMNVHAPLVMYISSRAKKSCHFYDISTRVKYETKLPTFVGKIFLGCSSGYLIFQDFHKNVWVINPLTGHKLQFPNMPQTKKPLNRSDRAIFASFGSGSRFALIVLSQTHETIRYCILRDTTARWRYLSFAKEYWKIVDLVVFDGRVYALTNNSRIGVFNFRTCRFRFLTLGGTPWLTTFVRLVASKKQLLIVHFLPIIFRAKVYTIDLERLKWVKVEDLGDEALFVGAWMSSKSGSTTNWRGLRNCVYHLPFGSNMCNIYSLNEESRGRFQICEPDMTHKIYCWYFLHQAYSPDIIKNED